MAYCAVHPRSLNIFLNSYFFSQSQTLSPLSVTRAAWHVVVCLKSKICLPLIHFCSAWILPPSVKISPVIWRGGKLDTVLQPGPVPITSCVSCWQYVGKTGPGDKVLDRHYIDSTHHICGLKLGINWQSQLLFSSINLCSLDSILMIIISAGLMLGVSQEPVAGAGIMWRYWRDERYLITRWSRYSLIKCL